MRAPSRAPDRAACTSCLIRREPGMKPESAPRSFWRVCLIAAFAASAFTAAVAGGGITPAHAIATTLYDQTTGTVSSATPSDAYSDIPAYNAETADNFTVP